MADSACVSPVAPLPHCRTDSRLAFFGAAAPPGWHRCKAVIHSCCCLSPQLMFPLCFCFLTRKPKQQVTSQQALAGAGPPAAAYRLLPPFLPPGDALSGVPAAAAAAACFSAAAALSAAAFSPVLKVRRRP